MSQGTFSIFRKIAILKLVLFFSLFANSCGYNEIQIQDEQVKAAWAEVLNQYQRRNDLIPNFVNTVKGYAAQEKEVLIEVARARASVGSVQATPEILNNPELFAQFNKVQGQMSSALSRLMIIVEKYPELKSNENFRDLQAQLEGTENRIAIARNRYIKSVQEFNITVRTFPNVITAKALGYGPKPSFTVENEAEISKPPKVEF
ncbi:LemA family protein [Leptospira andrefontaineae]|uniref:LemA family protein n=1 Tax=Leptospira andrefontaineae TaxID=2484976 RepID=A0A4R9H8D4_9LEPT|nr:LemA family protein [Leptospira andrefontaineae]TGK42290.1 LemA family protein [Leptospira andrefontaineae]